MKKLIIVLSFGFISLASFAHQPEISSTVLVEKADNVWLLQVSAPLTAFQQEIKTHFAETPYTTPEEFQQMVLEHIKNNLQINVNNTNHVTLTKGRVTLGHETKVIFKVLGISSNLHSVEVTNTAFKDVYNSKSTLVVLKENFKQNKFSLNNANHHSLRLMVVDNEFMEIVEQKASLFSPTVFFFLMSMLGIGLVFNFKKRKVKLLKAD